MAERLKSARKLKRQSRIGLEGLEGLPELSLDALQRGFVVGFEA
jgi:hypothetical protein